MQGQMREQKLGQKITRVQEACRKKLDEVHDAYRQASGRQDKLPVAFTSWNHDGSVMCVSLKANDTDNACVRAQ